MKRKCTNIKFVGKCEIHQTHTLVVLMIKIVRSLLKTKMFEIKKQVLNTYFQKQYNYKKTLNFGRQLQHQLL